MIEIGRDHSRRVKRWSSGEMALRWAAPGMLAAQARFRRIKGYRQLPQLVAALEAATADGPWSARPAPRCLEPECRMQSARRTQPKFHTKRDILLDARPAGRPHRPDPERTQFITLASSCTPAALHLVQLIHCERILE